MGSQKGSLAAIAGAAVSLAIIAMKALPFVPGSFTRPEWVSFALWLGLGLVFWSLRTRDMRKQPSVGPPDPAQE
jgi:hypothetical protein